MFGLGGNVCEGGGSWLDSILVPWAVIMLFVVMAPAVNGDRGSATDASGGEDGSEG